MNKYLQIYSGFVVSPQQSKKSRKREHSIQEDDLEPPVKKIHIKMADLAVYVPFCYYKLMITFTYQPTDMLFQSDLIYILIITK